MLDNCTTNKVVLSTFILNVESINMLIIFRVKPFLIFKLDTAKNSHRKTLVEKFVYRATCMSYSQIV